MLNSSLLTVIELGLIYSLVAIAVYLSFRVVNFADLTVDGSFPLGAAVTAVLLTSGMNPIAATFLAVLAGMMAGAVTGGLSVYLRMLGLLASILTMSALYSINLRVMGRPNMALLDVPTLFSHYSSLAVIGVVVVIVVLGLTRFLTSNFGLALRAVGQNPKMSRAYGVNLGKMTILTLGLSNGLVALAGALFAQSQGFADVSFGTGTIITGLASLMIGESLCGKRRVFLELIGCVLGAILYRGAIAFALNSQDLGLLPSDLNLVTAGLVILALGLPYLQRGVK